MSDDSPETESQSNGSDTEHTLRPSAPKSAEPEQPARKLQDPRKRNARPERGAKRSGAANVDPRSGLLEWLETVEVHARQIERSVTELHPLVERHAATLKQLDAASRRAIEVGVQQQGWLERIHRTIVRLGKRVRAHQRAHESAHGSLRDSVKHAWMKSAISAASVITCFVGLASWLGWTSVQSVVDAMTRSVAERCTELAADLAELDRQVKDAEATMERAEQRLRSLESEARSAPLPSGLFRTLNLEVPSEATTRDRVRDMMQAVIQFRDAANDRITDEELSEWLSEFMRPTVISIGD